MAKAIRLRLLVVSCCFFVLSPAALAGQGDLEASLRAADAQQLQAIMTRDDKAMATMAHANLRINAPTGRILKREELLSMMASGEIATERFERTPESVTITGNLGVVMGGEIVVPTATSTSGQMFGAGKTLQRRYTNVYLLEQGAWKFIARHANVVPTPSK